MRIVLINLIFMFLCSTSFATEYYVYIQKKDDPVKRLGLSEKGDIVHITPQEPKNHEFGNYDIVIVDLTEDEKFDLLQAEGFEDANKEVLNPTKDRKFKVKDFKPTVQKERVDKSVFFGKVNNKSNDSLFVDRE